MNEKEIDPDIEYFVKSHAEYAAKYEEFSLNNQQVLSKAERLSLVFKICGDMPSASDGVYAKLQLDTALNVIEDSFSRVDYAPKGKSDDGRMYPAQRDYRIVNGYEQIVTYRHRAHSSHFGCNGSINIETLKKVVLFDKVGKDGNSIGDLRALTAPKVSSSNS